jgi:3-oxoacyl-[acyl-carrier protein] reductase
LSPLSPDIADPPFDQNGHTMPLISLDTPRPALVTGASRGIGRAIALALAEMGCPVIIGYARNASLANDVAHAITSSGGRAATLSADLNDMAHVDRFAMDAAAPFGPVGILVNNAGIAARRDVFTNDVANFDETFSTNVRTAFALTQRLIGPMRDAGFGRLIFLSSTAARTGGVMSAPYAGSKAAIEGMMHHYALNLAAHGITSNAISPAFIATDMMANATVPPAMPVKRFGTVSECAMVAQLLVANSFINGQTIQVNGGIYMT